MGVTAEQKKQVKGQGFLHNRGTDEFSARIITENGVLNAAQLKNISEVAEQFGNGQVTFTTRLTVEIPGIAYEDIEKVKAYVAKEQMETGGTGAKVRPVVACKGTTCVFGLIDTQGLAKEIHDRFYKGYGTVTLPHKFKIAVGGCPNNCVKPDLNDVGIMGQRVPALNKDLCRGCKKCRPQAACPMDAMKFKDGVIHRDKSVCNNCGRCITTCPFGVMPDGTVGYRVYIGGRWGKKTRHGDMLKELFTKEEALDVVEKAILLFKEKGEPGERFGSMVERIGLEKVEKELMSDHLLKHKNEILGLTIEGACR